MQQRDAPIDWTAVRWAADFVPAFEARGFRPGVWLGGENGEDGVFVMPFWSPSPLVERFIDGLYGRRLIEEFDWKRWPYGRALAEQPERIARSGARTCLRLLTMHVRADRFVEGHLAAMFASGQIVAILRRLQALATRAGINQQTKETP